jgi:STAS-like domain of unknown function (DUF4325)
MPYRYALAEHGTTFATRPFGKQLRDDLIQRGAGSELVMLDFSGVLSVSHSFADEFVAALAEEATSGAVGFEISLAGAGSDVEGVVRRALDRRGVQVAQAV